MIERRIGRNAFLRETGIVRLPGGVLIEHLAHCLPGKPFLVVHQRIHDAIAKFS